jgi:hypothetical protein
VTIAIEEAPQPSIGRRIWLSWGWLIAILAGFLWPVSIVLILWVDGIWFPGLGLGLITGGVWMTAVTIAFVGCAGLQLVALFRWVLVGRGGGRLAAAAFLFCAAASMGLMPTILTSLAMKFAAAGILADRSAPLLAAIQAYETSNGAPPATLDDLVPKYLPERPWTGSAFFPDYDYQRQGASWSLSIPLSEIFKWDVLFYCPNRDCLKDMRSARMIGDWAFYNE